jgi:hypothetical protein
MAARAVLASVDPSPVSSSILMLVHVWRQFQPPPWARLFFVSGLIGTRTALSPNFIDCTLSRPSKKALRTPYVYTLTADTLLRLPERSRCWCWCPSSRCRRVCPACRPGLGRCGPRSRCRWWGHHWGRRRRGDCSNQPGSGPARTCVTGVQCWLCPAFI